MQKRRAANGRSYVDWAAWAGLTDHNHEHLADLASAGVRGYKCFLVDPGIEGLQRLSLNGLRRAAPILAEIGLPLLVHAELPEAIDAATNSLRQSDWKEYVTYLRSRPDEAELDAIQLLIQLCRKYRFKVHVVHLATSLAFKHLTVARKEGLPITVETCPHYLHFAAEDVIPSQTLLKCAPPIRSRQNREALWDGLRGGIIDLIVTDHSPCPPEMKQLSNGDFNRAWGGIASLPLAISVVWTGMKKRDIPLHILSNWMSRAPATLAGLSDRKGSIAVGMDADFLVFDPEATIEVTPQNLHYRHPVSAYMGEELYGNVQQTFLRGEEIYGMHKFPHAFSGTEIRL
jgi:allantoinase